MRNLPTVFQNGCTNLHLSQQSTRVTFSPHPCQQTFVISCLFFITPFLTDMRKQLPVVLICISLVINDVEYLFIGIYVCSLEKCLCGYSAYFNQTMLLSVSFAIELYESLYLLNFSLQIRRFANIFSKSISWIFILLVVSFAVYNLFSMM